MLSYQHAYHAGNAADVHKHALLALVLDYMAQKPKPLSYFETHSGRALYDLSGAEAAKTGEATRGIQHMAPWFDIDHPYARVLAATRQQAGPSAYPGSPMIARHLLRAGDHMTLAELHPQEAAALRKAVPGADIREADGPQLALSMAPPTPRRGLCLVDPSYEVKSEFKAMPDLLAKLHRKWSVGVLILWYPILASGAEAEMVRALDRLKLADVLHSRVSFPPARPGHGMVGSGLFVVNPPWGLDKQVSALEARFSDLV